MALGQACHAGATSLTRRQPQPRIPSGPALSICSQPSARPHAGVEILSGSLTIVLAVGEGRSGTLSPLLFKAQVRVGFGAACPCVVARACRQGQRDPHRQSVSHECSPRVGRRTYPFSILRSNGVGLTADRCPASKSSPAARMDAQRRHCGRTASGSEPGLCAAGKRNCENSATPYQASFATDCGNAGLTRLFKGFGTFSR